MRITNWIIEKCEIESANYVRMEKETYPPPQSHRKNKPCKWE